MSDESTGDPRDGSNRDPSDGPASALAGVWDDLVDDATAIAAAYREEGWDVRRVEVVDVTPLDDPGRDRFGLGVLVPGDEYAAIEELVEREGVSFDAAEIFRRSVDGTVFVVAVERDAESEAAVVVPLCYSLDRAAEVLETALEDGELRIHLRPLSIENWVTFEHDEPALFVPDEDGSDEPEGGEGDRKRGADGDQNG